MVPSPKGAVKRAEPFTPQPAAATAAAAEKVLCQHCGRTASNGLRCIGMCVADNEY